MLLVSIGTGFNPEESPGLRGRDLGFYRQAKGTAIGLFNAAMFQQDMLCRAFGKCVAGDPLDREVGAMIGIGKRPVAQPLFTYARYNADITPAHPAAVARKIRTRREIPNGRGRPRGERYSRQDQRNRRQARVGD